MTSAANRRCCAVLFSGREWPETAFLAARSKRSSSAVASGILGRDRCTRSPSQRRRCGADIANWCGARDRRTPHQVRAGISQPRSPRRSIWVAFHRARHLRRRGPQIGRRQPGDDLRRAEAPMGNRLLTPPPHRGVTCGSPATERQAICRYRQEDVWSCVGRNRATRFPVGSV